MGIRTSSRVTVVASGAGALLYLAAAAGAPAWAAGVTAPNEQPNASQAQQLTNEESGEDELSEKDAWFEHAPLAGVGRPGDEPSVRMAVGANKWGCGANVPNVHTSKGQVKVHGVIKCKAPVPWGSVKNVQLWRSRWWGWQKVGKSGSYSNTNAKHIDAWATWKAKSNECFHYRGTASFKITGMKNWNEVFNFDKYTEAGKKEVCGSNWK
ncbi:hypothetical protein [Streptomyces olivaceiscleroticus]|uniref:Secreted protein n=1 Tax=Streptomyces olivaceiscleroticus TaxID=68245 RepID=A0ABN1BCF1_9ACTN